MNIESLIKELTMLKEENSKLKSQLENYNNSRKSYYEKNKDYVKSQAKVALKKLAEENPDKLKEYRRKTYLKRKKKIQNENIEKELDNLK
jgi:hypothetical protein